MSQAYTLEPPTKGKVTLKTTLGDLDVELWPKEAPQACRNFVQLCMEDYYNNTIFHRVIKDYIIQGGDPTGTGNGGESIYGMPFPDEFHSRLQFRRRALVACANASGRPNSNGSQFFITLSRCDWLTKKHTIFGSVTGDTIYNLMKFNDLDVNSENDRPEEPPVIVKSEIVWNPFDDIEPRKAKAVTSEATAKKQDKRGRVKNVNLLSFGDEEEFGEDDTPFIKPKKIQSAHDVAENDPKLLKTTEKDRVETLNARQRVQQALKKKAAEASVAEADKKAVVDNSSEALERRMKDKMNEIRREMNDLPDDDEPCKPNSTIEDDKQISDKEEAQRSEQERTHSRLHLKKAFNAKMGKLQDADLMTESEAKRRTIKRKRKITANRERDTLARLQKFSSVLHQRKEANSKKEESDQSDEIKQRQAMPAAWRIDDYLDADSDDFDDMKSHVLKFSKVEGKDAMAKRDNVDDYTVYDPLLEKGKGKWNSQNNRERKHKRSWKGRSIS